MTTVCLVVWSSVVSLAYAVLALASPPAADVAVVAFVALLVVPATAHLVNRKARHR